MKDFFQFRDELKEARNQRQVVRKVGLPVWAKTAALGLLNKVRQDGNAYVSNDDPKVKDRKLASAITTSAAISTLGLAVNSNDKTLVSRAKSMMKKR